MKNKKHSEETKRKMSNSATGIKKSKQSREKMSKNSPNRKGEKNQASKLTNEQVLEIRKLYITGNYSQEKLGQIFNISQSNIGRIVNKKLWKHL
jgi:predicted XRE-type DNA-binding protein